jgi:hypothetical protein
MIANAIASPLNFAPKAPSQPPTLAANQTRANPPAMTPRFLILLILLGFVAAAPAVAEPVYPPGMRIGLEPAGDLKTGPGLPGFQDADRKVTVTILELAPAAYAELERTIFGKDPAGAIKVERESFPFRTGIGYLHVARVVENNVAVQRWTLLASAVSPDQGFVALISVNIPDSVRAVYTDEAVRRMLASVTFRKQPIEERLSLIPFKLADLAGFRVIQVMPESVVLTDGTDSAAGQPYMIVSMGRGAPDAANDRQRFARDLLLSAPLRELSIQSAEDMRITGQPGSEIRAQGIDPHGTAVGVVQWLRFTGGIFIRIVGASPRDRWNDVFNRFRAVRDGVEPR